MLAFLVNEYEIRELHYLLKKEMEEIIFDIQDQQVEKIVKQVLEERYQTLFKLFTRVASIDECRKYVKVKKYHNKNG